MSIVDELRLAAGVYRAFDDDFQAFQHERWATEVEALTRRVAVLEDERIRSRFVFEAQRDRLLKARKSWQVAKGQPDLWPGLTELLDWLMERAVKLEVDNKKLKAENRKLSGGREAAPRREER